MKRQTITLVLAGSLLTYALMPATAEETVTAQGRVFEADGIKPLAGATIVIYDEKQQVLGHATADAEGRYTLTVPKSALHLVKAHHGGNFLGGLVKSAGKVLSVAAPIGMMAMTGGVGALGGLSSLGGLHAATSASSLLTGPGVLRGGMPGMMGGGMLIRRQAMQARMQGRGGVYPLQSTDMLEESMLPAPAPDAPGALVMKITCSNHADATGVGQIYWLREEQPNAGSGDRKEMSAWIDPVQLGDGGSGQSSQFKRGAFTFRNARFEPSVVEYGQTATLSVNLMIPTEPRADIVVVARNVGTGDLIELNPAGDGVYKAEISVDKKIGKNDITFSILAYARATGEEGRSKKSEDALHGAGLWDLKKPYIYDPLIAVSRNRADVTLTVVKPATR